MAEGAKRTAGYFSQVLKFPVNAGTTLTPSELVYQTTCVSTLNSYVVSVPITNQIAVGYIIVAPSFPDNTTVVSIAPSATPNYLDVTLSNKATATSPQTIKFYTVKSC